jgi:hypothetical protein
MSMRRFTQFQEGQAAQLCRQEASSSERRRRSVCGCAFRMGGMLASGLVRRVAAAGDGDRQELLLSVRTMSRPLR